MSGPLSCPNGKPFAGVHNVANRDELRKKGKLNTGKTAIKKGLLKRYKRSPEAIREGVKAANAALQAGEEAAIAYLVNEDEETEE